MFEGIVQEKDVLNKKNSKLLDIVKMKDKFIKELIQNQEGKLGEQMRR